MPKPICGNWKHFKNDDKCFFFHLKSSLLFQDMYFIFLNFLVMYKNGLIRKIMLTSNFIKSQPATPHINSETSPPPSIINVVCKYLRQFLDTSYSANMRQDWVGGRGLIFFCNVDHSRISRKSSRNLLVLNNLCEILSKNLKKLGK